MTLVETVQHIYAAFGRGDIPHNLEVRVWWFNAYGKVDRFNHVVDTLQHRQVVAA